MRLFNNSRDFRLQILSLKTLRAMNYNLLKLQVQSKCIASYKLRIVCDKQMIFGNGVCVAFRLQAGGEQWA